MIKWILHEAWEKINLAHAYRQLKELGKKHGRRFFWVALGWEIVEDVVLPFISWKMGAPGLIPVFLILHFEPIVYPIFFWGFKMWDRAHGREPWDPDRPVHSAYWRSVIKVAVFQVAVLGWVSHFINWKPLIAYGVLTSLFGFVHERIWHDTNYGILDTDQVQYRRGFAKTGTYLLMTAFTLFPLMSATGTSPIVWPMVAAMLITGVMYSTLETVWAKSKWGVQVTLGEK